jgi:hypothetical protein
MNKYNNETLENILFLLLEVRRQNPELTSVVEIKSEVQSGVTQPQAVPSPSIGPSRAADFKECALQIFKH